MANYIKTLKDDNGDTVYPQTLASAVYIDSTTDLSSRLKSVVNATRISGDERPQSSIGAVLEDGEGYTLAPVTHTDFLMGSITKDKMIGLPSPDTSNVINDWGEISASGDNNKTISQDGFIIGKGCTFGGDQSAYVMLNGMFVGGICYTTWSGYMQVAYCFPVKAGDVVSFKLNKSGPVHQGCRLLGWKM